MKSVQQINALNGQTATREQLLEIAVLAYHEEQFHVASKIYNLLKNYDSKNFNVDLESPILESLPSSCINSIENWGDEDNLGLNKSVSPNEIYQKITDLIINTIEEVGHLPWQKEWKGTGLTTARNYVTGEPYTGINAITLPYEIKEIKDKTVLVEPLSKDVFYLTFNQIEKLGARLKKDSKSRMVMYYSTIFNYSDDKNRAIKTVDAKTFNSFVNENKITKEEIENNLSRFRLLKYYRVFRAIDCENLADRKEIKAINVEPNEIAEKIIELYPNKPKIIIGKDERAYYDDLRDGVYMPKINAFSSSDFYYSTFFHELIHSTGNYKRLNRDMFGFFGDESYAFEELIAELGAVYLCSETGILFNTIDNSAKYLKGWNSRLVGKLKKDNKFIFKASAEAQKAANFILNLDENRKPAYLKYLAKKPEEFVKVSKKQNNKKPKALSKSEFYKKIKAIDIKDFRLKIGYLDGYMTLEKDYEKWIEKLRNFEIDSKDYKNIENELARIDKAIRLQLVEGAKYFKISETDFIAIINDFSEDKSEVKMLLFPKNSKPIKKSKIDKNGQISLLGVGLNGVPVHEEKSIEIPVEEIETEPQIIEEKPKKTIAMHKGVKSINDIGQTACEFYTVSGEIGKFLQAVERKPFESVVITMDGQQGAGKTTTLYKFMDAFASSGNRSLFISGEEHPESILAIEKRDKYLSEAAKKCISIIDHVSSLEELYKMIEPFDIVFIDSWQKLQRMIGTIRLDEDLRKKINGKVFVIIFQQTTTGRTKGGSEVVFDGDIIIKMVKEASFADNYAYFDKNRYTKVPIETIRYNIASGTVYNPEEKEPIAPSNEAMEEEHQPIEEPTEESKFNFSFNIN